MKSKWSVWNRLSEIDNLTEEEQFAILEEYSKDLNERYNIVENSIYKGLEFKEEDELPNKSE